MPIAGNLGRSILACDPRELTFPELYGKVEKGNNASLPMYTQIFVNRAVICFPAFREVLRGGGEKVLADLKCKKSEYVSFL